MLKLNESYSINDGQGVIVFSEGKKGTINANYEIKGKKDAGTINGTLSENLLKGTYHNSLNNSSGLIEFQFTENGFNCKWKQGLEPGPMRGKWEGALNSATRKSVNENNSESGNLSSAEKYLSYIRNENKWFQEKISKCSPSELIEEYSCEYDDEFFDDLKDHIDILRFRVDNSEYSIEEMNGADHIDIVYDLINNCAYAQYDDTEDDLYKYLLTNHASISESYENIGEFGGCFSVSNIDKTWSLEFHGNKLEDKKGNISDELLVQIKANINSETFYRFMSSVIDWF
jgi:hypothetical protein